MTIFPRWSFFTPIVYFFSGIGGNVDVADIKRQSDDTDDSCYGIVFLAESRDRPGDEQAVEEKAVTPPP